MTEELPDTDSVFIVGGGKVQRTALFQNDGITFTDVPSVDDIAAKWGEITDLSAAQQASFKLGWNLVKALAAQELTGTSGLAYVDVDDLAGDPAATGAVVIDVGAAGVCFPDLLLLRGEYQLRLEPPFTPAWRSPERCARHRRARVHTGTAGFGFPMIGGYAEQVAAVPANVIPTRRRPRRWRGGIAAGQLLHDAVRAVPPRRAAAG